MVLSSILMFPAFRLSAKFIETIFNGSGIIGASSLKMVVPPNCANKGREKKIRVSMVNSRFMLFRVAVWAFPG